VNGVGGSVSSIKRLKLGAGENPIGVYDNHTGSMQERILITNKGVYIYRENGWDSIRYEEIDSVGTPESKDVEGLTVRFVDGSSTEIPVRGKRGKFRDAFEFLRFLNRVAVDQ
jgi:hypothetical protein